MVLTLRPSAFESSQQTYFYQSVSQDPTTGVVWLPSVEVSVQEIRIVDFSLGRLGRRKTRGDWRERIDGQDYRGGEEEQEDSKGSVCEEKAWIKKEGEVVGCGVQNPSRVSCILERDGIGKISKSSGSSG